MCGIFGFVGTPYITITTIDEAAHVWWQTTERGRAAWGLTLNQDGETIRSAGRYEPLDGRDEATLREMLSIYPRKQEQRLHGNKRLIGNRRGEPTTEWVRGGMTDADIQPYTSPSGRWHFVHNGTIANDKQLLQELFYERQSIEKDFERPPTEIDSWVIGLALDEWGFNESVSARLTGSFAIIAIDTEGETDAMHFATNYKPLFFRATADGAAVLMASQRMYLVTDEWDPMRDPGIQEIAPYTTGIITPWTIEGFSLLNPPVHRRVLAVCSGGLDSSYAAWAHQQMGDDVTLFHLRYGCKAEGPEVDAVNRLAEKMGIEAVIIETDFFARSAGSVLTDADGVVNKSRGGVEGAELAHEWVPARNTVLLSLALAYAERHGYHVIALGNNLEEAGAYPDNEQEFINKFQALAPYAVKPYHPITFSQPAGSLMKSEIIRFGTGMGMPWELTWSCYEGGKVHCGTCGPCSMRQTAFRMEDVPDPTEYAV